MKKLFTLAVLLGLLLISGLLAEETKTPQAYPIAGVVINKQFISPGDLMLSLFSIAGLPDHMWAMRGQEQKDDYIKMDFLSYGASFNITSSDRENDIKGIMVKDNQLEIRNVPFKIGGSIDEVVSAWGKPDSQENKVICYWKRGVYFVTNAEGKIAFIYLTQPGKAEDGGSGDNNS